MCTLVGCTSEYYVVGMVCHRLMSVLWGWDIDGFHGPHHNHKINNKIALTLLHGVGGHCCIHDCYLVRCPWIFLMALLGLQ